MLPGSPLYRPEYAEQWARFDLAEANRLLDEIGLQQRGGDGIRLMPDGRPLQMIVETAGEEPSQIAMLQLMTETARSRRPAVLQARAARCVTQPSVRRADADLGLVRPGERAGHPGDAAERTGADQPTATVLAEMGPAFRELAAAANRWTNPGSRALRLYEIWTRSTDPAEKATLWHHMLAIRTENVFSIGTVRKVPQPVIVNDRLRNVPVEAIYNWEPGAFFGIYHPDTFWFDVAKKTAGG